MHPTLLVHLLLHRNGSVARALRGSVMLPDRGPYVNAGGRTSRCVPACIQHRALAWPRGTQPAFGTCGKLGAGDAADWGVESSFLQSYTRPTIPYMLQSVMATSIQHWLVYTAATHAQLSTSLASDCCRRTASHSTLSTSSHHLVCDPARWQPSDMTTPSGTAFDTVF